MQLGIHEYSVTTGDQSSGELESPAPISYAYQPFHRRYNGGVMFVQKVGSNHLWADQGDASSPIAYAMVERAMAGGDTKEGKWFFAYTASAAETGLGDHPDNSGEVDGLQLTLASDDMQPMYDTGPADHLLWLSWRDPQEIGYIGSPEGSYKVQNVLIPTDKDTDGSERLPFSHILRMIVSTGTPGYNHATYDVLPTEAGLGIPSALVDVASFEAADEYAGALAPSLSRRPLYVIHEPTPFREILKRECQLFGFAATWDTGQIKLKNIFSPEFQQSGVTLTESNFAEKDDFPSITSSVDTVINQYRFELGYSVREGKYFTEIAINDRASIEGVNATKEMKVKHPGVSVESNEAEIAGELFDLADLRMSILRYPAQVVQRTISPDLIDLIHVGDVVGVVHEKAHPDPFGTGLMSFSGKALVLDVSWNLETMRGSCVLFIYDRYSIATPWAPSAEVIAWDSVNYRLTLRNLEFSGVSTDPDDGAAFEVGDKVVIKERHPLDETNPATGPWSATVAYPYETDGAGILTLQSVSLTGISFTAMEYFVTFDDYDVVTDSQKTRGLWMADKQTQLLNAADAAQLWGG
jgi:hypothetical protein